MSQPPNHQIPRSEVTVVPEAGAPTWQLVWKKARQMGRKGDVDGAVALYTGLLGDRPGLLEARWELAQLLAQVGRNQEATHELEQYLEARPEDPKALAMLADLLAQLGQWSRAVGVYGRLGDLIRGGERQAPIGLDEVTYRMARCLSALGDDQEALRRLREAYDLRPDRADVALDIAWALIRLERQTEALPYLQRLAPQYPRDAVFLERHARALMAVGRREEAAPVLRQILHLGLEVPGEKRRWAQTELVRLYLMEGKADAAIETFRSLTRGDLDPSVQRRLARLYFGRERYLDALDVFEGLLAQDPKDREALSFVARIYERLHLWARAVEAYRRLWQLDPEPEIRRHFVSVLIRMGRFEEADSLVDDDLVAAWEREEEGLRLLLELYEGLGRLKAAQQVIGTVRSHLTGSEELAAKAVALALTLKEGGGPADEVLVRSAEVLAGEGWGWWPVLQVVVQELRQRGREDLATGVVSLCWRLDRAPWAGLEWLELVRSTTGPDKALDLGADLLREDPQADPVRLIVAGLLAEKASPEGLPIVLAPLEGRGPWWDEQLGIVQARVALVAGRYEDALAATRVLLEGAPNHLRARLARREIFRAYGLSPEAAAETLGISLLRGVPMGVDEGPPKVYLRGEELLAPGAWTVASKVGGWSPDPAVLVNLGRGLGPNEALALLLPLAYEGHGDREEAEVSWRTFVRRHPGHWMAQERLMRLLAADGKAAEAATVMAAAMARLVRNSQSAERSSYRAVWTANGSSVLDLAQLWTAWQEDAKGASRFLPADTTRGVWLPGRGTWEALEALALSTWSRRLSLP